MVLYGITFVPLSEDLRAEDLGLISSFYTDDAAFNSSEQQISQLLKLLMKREPERGCFPNPDKPLFISDTLGLEEAARREFVVEGLVLNFVSGSRYMEVYLVPQKELEAWVRPQV